MWTRFRIGDVLIFRSGVPIAVPADYSSDPQHRAVVDHLNRAVEYVDVVALLEQHTTSFLAADVLTGALWAQRFLNTTARLHQVEPALARRGLRALMSVLNGTKPRIGRHRAPRLASATLARADAAVARWRTRIESVWHPDRAYMVSAVTTLAETSFPLSRSHRTALRALARRKSLRKHDVVLTLASWETGVPLRRLRAVHPVDPVELVYA